MQQSSFIIRETNEIRPIRLLIMKSSPNLPLQRLLVFEVDSCFRFQSPANNGVLRYVDRYNGRVVHTETIPVMTETGATAQVPIITIYEVRP